MASPQSFATKWLPGPSAASSSSALGDAVPAEASTSRTPPGSTTSPPQRKKRELSGWKHSAAGSLGGMTGAIVTSPFDVMKTRLQSDLFRHHAAPASVKGKETARTLSQAQAVGARRGVSGALYQFIDTGVLIRRIATEEGWRALFKGLGPTLVGIIPARAINFYFYPTSKVYLAKQFPNAPTTQSGQTAEDSPVVHLGAAVIAGLMTATGTNPIWVVKTRMQLSARKKYLSPSFYSATSAPSPLPGPIAASAAALSQSATLTTSATTPARSSAAVAPRVAANAVSTALDIMRNEGIRGLYRGLSASYLGVSEGVIQWVLYERFKRIGKPKSQDAEDKRSALSFITSIVGASGGAKAVASLLTYPHEVVRTRLRQPHVNGVKRYTGLVQTLKLVVREEGVAALYGGLTAHMLRVVPNAACMFLIYEVVAGKLGS